MAAANANIPTEMAMKLLKEWNARGYGLDVVLYRKYDGSTYVDPHEEEKVAFKDLPNRFPSVLSRDFRKEQGRYEDFDNLFAMYVLYNLGKYSVRVNDATKLLEIGTSKNPMAYAGGRQARHARAPGRTARTSVGAYRSSRRGAPIGEFHGQRAPRRDVSATPATVTVPGRPRSTTSARGWRAPRGFSCAGRSTRPAAHRAASAFRARP